jgi:hypothetical protein
MDSLKDFKLVLEDVQNTAPLRWQAILQAFSKLGKK